MVIGADAGVQIETAKLWRRLQAAGKPCIVFVNQMDKEHANFANVLADLRDKLPAASCRGGADRRRRGILRRRDLLRGTALTHMGGQESPGTVPGDLEDTIEEYRQGVIEGAAEGSDELTEKYLEEETLSDDEVRTGLAASLHANLVVPVLAGSATLNSGVACLLDVARGGGAGAGGRGRRSVGVRVQDQPGPVLRQAVMDQGDERRDHARHRVGGHARRPQGTHHQAVYPVRLATGRQRRPRRRRPRRVHQADQRRDRRHPCPAERPVLSALDLPQPVHAVTLAAQSKKDEDKLGQFCRGPRRKIPRSRFATTARPARPWCRPWANCSLPSSWNG